MKTIVFSLVMAFGFLAIGGEDGAGADVRARLASAIRKGDRTVELEPKTYVFSAADTTPMSFFVSNHDQEDPHPVNLPIVGVTNLTIRGNGARLLFCGRTIPLVVVDSKNVRVENLSVDFRRHFLTEGAIVGFDNGHTLLRVDGNAYPTAVRDGKIRMIGDGWDLPVSSAKLYDGRTRELVEGSGDIPYAGEASLRGDGLLDLAWDFSRSGRGGHIGDVVALRPRPRPNPAIFICRTADSYLENVSVHSSLGMALLAQRSENVIWRGTGRPEERRCGVFPSGNRYSSTHADASHFSNVKGRVLVENCLFEGMMDDAINVHSTCLMITNVVSSNRIRCRYMHFQSVGFGVFAPGDALRFVDGLTLENGPIAKVTAMEVHDDRELTLTLDRPLPPDMGVGDAVENADYQCSAEFRRNVVRFNRARGALFTTSRPVVVESNLFDRVSGSAILFAGDAHYWFESGACRNVVIRGNVFRNCLTSYGHHDFCEGILSFYPMIERPDEQRERYHRNVTITGNLFETFDAPILYAMSVDGLSFCGNRIVVNGDYRSLDKRRFSVNHSTNVVIRSSGVE